ncbi:MAG: PIG-L deacetylase family protein [Acidimicrobiales bacterium]
MDRPGLIDANTVATLGDLLTVWAHPDDETYLAGGLMAAAIATGARVTCVVATSGERGGPPDQQAELSWRREEELTDALSALGVTDVVLQRLPDGGCSALDPSGPVATIAGLIDDHVPDTVITFGPDGLTGHADHRAVSAWVTAALTRRGTTRPRLLQAAITPTMAASGADIHARFTVYEPGLPVTRSQADLAVHLNLNGGLLDTKIRALRAHASQTSVLEAAIGPDTYREWVATECFVDADPADDARLRQRIA